MQFKACVLVALAAAVSAQNLPNESILLQLATALPPSILAVAATNQAAFASEIASSIRAGNTPAWYQALPTEVKNALASIYPVSTAVVTTAYETAAPSVTSAEVTTPEVTSSAEVTTEVTTEVTSTSITVITTSVPVVIVPSGTGGSSIGSNSTGITTVNTPTQPSGTQGSGAPEQSEFPGAASFPSTAIGAGLAGAMAFLGMLVL